MSEPEALFSVLRQSADAQCVAAIERAVREAPDRDLCRVNALTFAAQHGLDEERVIAAFLHAARLGLFELSWNVLCPGCGGVLDAGATLKTLNREEYACGLCASGYEPILDEMVEVTFTVSSRVRRIAAHSPDTLPEVEYYRQIFWGSGVDLPETLGDSLAAFTIDSIELPPGEKAVLSVQLPNDFVILFDPVTHGAQFIDFKGEPTRERQTLSMVFNKLQTLVGTVELRPGPLRVSLDNQTDRRVLPGLWIAGDRLHDLLGRCPPSGSSTTSSPPRSASGGRSSRPSACCPTRPSATSIAPTRSTSTSGSRSPASPSCSPTSKARPRSMSASAISWPTISCASISAFSTRSWRRRRERW